MAKITWTNKTTLNPQPSIARENKVIDDDMNEIKQVVNANDDNVGDLADLDTTDKSSLVNAVNELATGWTSLGTQTGSTAIALPNNFKELIVDIDQVGTSKNYTFHFIKEQLSSSSKVYINGAYISNSNASQIGLNISLTSVNIGYTYNNGGTETTSTSILKAWYR